MVQFHLVVFLLRRVFQRMAICLGKRSKDNHSPCNLMKNPNRDSSKTFHKFVFSVGLYSVSVFRFNSKD